jgi:dihydroorotate dehydrogenase electron transfer subunit
MKIKNIEKNIIKTKEQPSCSFFLCKMKGIVTKTQKTARATYALQFSVPDGFDVKPGQFVSILCDNLTLRRPFSVADFDGTTATVLFKLKGKGTSYLSGLQAGDEIDVVGALGNGFEIVDGKALVIGAGIGIAPVYFLNKFLKNSHFVGAFNSEDEIPQGFEPDEVIVGGTILDHLKRLIAEHKPVIIYACGPSVVLKAIAQCGITSQIAMEKVMACGIGVCKGCVIKTKQGNATICHDGPVFKGSEVVWE